MRINKAECEKAGVDIRKVRSIARRISKAAQEAEDLGIYIFGGAWGGNLRFDDETTLGDLILANLDGKWEGGCGATNSGRDGFLRGEY